VRNRRTHWGDDSPADFDGARARLLNAAEECYGRLGVDRATVDDIAAAAHVHRTTVYKYFSSRDEILTGVVLREGEAVLARGAAHLDGYGTFVDRLVDAYLASFDSIRRSRYLRLLFETNEQALRTPSAFEAFRERTELALRPHVEAAVVDGELRDDIPVIALTRWMLRVFLMLVANPPRRDEGNVESILRRFLLPSIVDEIDVRAAPLA
jgi:AcrR family transcriptional regulator